MKGRTTATSKVWNSKQNETNSQILTGWLFLLITLSALTLSSVVEANNFQQAQVKRLHGQIVERVSAHRHNDNKSLRDVVGLETYRGRTIQTHKLKTRANDLKGLMQKPQLETRGGDIYYPAEIENALVKGEEIQIERVGRAPINDDGGFGK